jgi:hypothetical protein
MKTAGSDGKVLYRLADMEEIEINSNTVTNFLNEECADEDDYGIEMTIFYFNNNLKCGQFTAICNRSYKNIFFFYLITKKFFRSNKNISSCT